MAAAGEVYGGCAAFRGVRTLQKKRNFDEMIST
jgi:hypothetical protein